MNPVTRQVLQAAGPILLVLGMASMGGAAGAQETASSQTFSYDQLFDAGRYEAALTSGVLFSPFGPSRMRQTNNYTVTGLELGYMLGDVKGEGWWRGNFELAGEGFGSIVYDGPGGYIAGATLWLRYNFVPRISLGLAPYFQVGGGFVSTDVDHGIVGQPFNFNLDVGAGVRYMIARNWAISLEFRYQHISNANLNNHNLGINAAGPILGVSYFF